MKNGTKCAGLSRPGGFEPPTRGLEIRYSSPLSYGRKVLIYRGNWYKLRKSIRNIQISLSKICINANS